MVCLLRGDERERLAYPRISRAKKAAAFLRISRSIPTSGSQATQRPQLLTLIRRQPLALASIDVGVLDPSSCATS